jgi:hypothetical protein
MIKWKRGTKAIGPQYKQKFNTAYQNNEFPDLMNGQQQKNKDSHRHANGNAAEPLIKKK